MAVPFSNTRLRVPRGFQSILEGFAREVLRSQPKDIYSFGALYFEELVRRREETGEEDVAQIAAKLEDRFYNNSSFQNPDVDPSNPSQQGASTVIQTNYRRHAAQKEAERLREDKAASEIQSAVRGHHEREVLKTSNNEVEDAQQSGLSREESDVPVLSLVRAPVIGTSDDEQEVQEDKIDIDLNDPEVVHAASKIQAGFKGYKTRKDMDNQGKTTEDTSSAADETKVLEGAAEDDKHSQQEIELAATKIQAGFRGYETRKHMKENNATKQPEQEKEGPTEEAGETKAEVSADVTTEAKTEESSESKVNETSEIIAEDTSESKVDETSESKVEETSESKVEETSETKVAEIPDTVGEESSEEKVAESSETKVEETPEDNVVVDSSEVKVEETTEVKTEDVVEETTESETKQQDSEDKEQEQADTEAVPATTDETEAFETKKEEEAAAPPPAEEPKKEEEAQPDVDLDDPSLNDAATKIQAGFKGFQARKQVEEMKKEKDDEQQPEDVPQENHEEDSEELEAAATKIQAGFKGYKTRKELDKQQHPEGGSPDYEVSPPE